MKKKETLQFTKESLLPLPEGASIVKKPELFDLYRKGRGTGDKWIAYYQRLMTMGATQSLAFDFSNVADQKKHRIAVVNGVRWAAKKMGTSIKVKYALIGSTLYLTT